MAENILYKGYELRATTYPVCDLQWLRRKGNPLQAYRRGNHGENKSSLRFVCLRRESRSRCVCAGTAIDRRWHQSLKRVKEASAPDSRAGCCVGTPCSWAWVEWVGRDILGTAILAALLRHCDQVDFRRMGPRCSMRLYRIV